ncbi:GatB/YqeY domain-containing protein [Macrolepiota fuliginosa MF-IS2]|uniref:Altered inheritance of mitochondria protein 41 n=1 Tax=Macrolepiota fuliginosa MF-IS2 TaxID=1400762 RepID=A0A9P6C408_9AGAR|nr:GatB/YqeY domain-containing protein [Macrolepiota fuliginosa MF-IS2]
MQAVFRILRTPHASAIRQFRAYTVPAGDSHELRTRLMSDIKTALKAKDSATASTLRSVLADVQAADKIHKDRQVSASAIRGLIAKGIARRHEAALQYDKAKRSDLAMKERQEADILQKLLPPAMSEARIDETLKQIIDSLPVSGGQHSLGQVFKAFYAQVDKSLVRPDVLKRRAQALLAAASPSSPAS